MCKRIAHCPGSPFNLNRRACQLGGPGPSRARQDECGIEPSGGAGEFVLDDRQQRVSVPDDVRHGQERVLVPHPEVGGQVRSRAAVGEVLGRQCHFRLTSGQVWRMTKPSRERQERYPDAHHAHVTLILSWPSRCAKAGRQPFRRQIDVALQNFRGGNRKGV